MTSLQAQTSHQSDTPATVSATVDPRRLRQIEWEHEQVQAGIRRYRASLVKITESGETKRKAMVGTEPGSLIVSEVIAPLVNAILDAQAGVVDAWANPNLKKVTEGDWVLLALPAETLAALTALHALGSPVDVKFTGLARGLGTVVQHEYDYMRWRKAEREAAKGNPEHLDLTALMAARNKVVDQRVFRKWSKKAQMFSSSAWEVSTRLSAGYVLLALLVESSGWFRVFESQIGAKSVRMFGLSEGAQKFVANRHAQNELLRPYLLPMIEPPDDYCY